MHHGAKTASRAGAPKKLFAGIAALGLAAGAYGVYATTLSVGGSAGTSLQAGSAPVTPTARCQTTQMTVTENFTNPEFNSTDGYPVAQRTGWTISGIAAGCNARTISLAVKSDAAAEGEATAFVNIGSQGYDHSTADGSLTFSVPTDPSYPASATAADDTKGYSIKIA